VQWRHRVGRGSPSVEVLLPDGDQLRSGEFSAVLNRVIAPPLAGLARTSGEDSAYARSEQIAFSLSWLRALAPLVVNPPTARGLAGAWRSSVEWRSLGRAAGLDVEPLVRESLAPEPASVFPQLPPTGMVIGDEAFGAAAEPRVKAAAIRLSQMAETPILGLWLSADRHRRLTMATPHPVLSLGGKGGVAALERVLGA
jgi:hypothetical protein